MPSSGVAASRRPVASCPHPVRAPAREAGPLLAVEDVVYNRFPLLTRDPSLLEKRDDA